MQAHRKPDEAEAQRAGAAEGERAGRPWHKLEADEVIQALDSQRDGLSEAAARQRLERHGRNRIGRQRRVNAWRVLAHQFKSPLIYVLLGALVVTVATSLITGEARWADAIVIGIVLAVNGTIGFLQEYRAEHAVEKLMEMVAPKATARREGRARKVPADELVPGDVVEVRQGQVVPADLRLLDTQSLQVNEAALTGESVPASKSARAMRDAGEDVPPADQKSMAFMGTAVTSGRASGVVVSTGMRTQIGKIAEQVEEAGQSQTPLQRRIHRLAIWITWGILIVSAIAFGVGLLMGRDWSRMITLAVALAVAAIPAGLPIVVTVALAIGVRRMAQQHAVIRHLPAVDTLGSCTTIVSDKTGTLTQNRMTTRVVQAGGRRFEVTGAAQSEEGGCESEGKAVEPSEHRALYETLLVGVLCNDAELPGARERSEGDRQARDAGEGAEDAEGGEEPTPAGDPMEVALLYAGLKAGLERGALQERHPRTDEVPFKTERRFMATLHEPEPDDSGGAPLVLVKGAAEAVARMCSRRRTDEGGDEPLDRDEVARQNDALAGEGLRVLAMAVGRGEEAARAVEQDEPGEVLTFVGLQGMLDPPRPSAIEAVDACHRAGIRVIMVTGDHASTASAIAREVHLDRPARAELQEPGAKSGRESAPAGAAEVGVRFDTTGLTPEAAQRAAQRISVDARVPGHEEVRVRVEVGDRVRDGDPRQAHSAPNGARAERAGAGQPQALGRAHTGQDVDSLGDERLEEVLSGSNVFARVKPAQKTRIVERLKAMGEVVAVTGDGVNDAPALKAAHIGAAMGAGTDVAKEASDMVITDDNFASVYRAVEQGRTAFRNIRMATFFLLSTGAAMVLLILAALGMRWPLPLLPAQILWCNVVTNGIADVALAFEPGERSLYRRPPRPPAEGVLDRVLIERLVIVGIWLALGTLGMFLWKWGFDVRTWEPGSEENLTLAQTAALTTMVLFQKVHVFNCRSESVSIFRTGLLRNKVLLAGVLASLAVHVAAVYLPWLQQLLGITALDGTTWLVAALVASTAIVVNELHKWLRPRFR